MSTCAVCKIAAPLRCSGCQIVGYCSKPHQNQDWPNHRKNCRLCKVKTSDNGDRYIAATKDIETGAQILREGPIILGPYPFSVKSPQFERDEVSCIGCLRLLSGSVKTAGCPRCQWPACSKTCPGLTDPALHGGECELLAALKSNISYHCLGPILPLRCLTLQKTDPKKWTVIKGMAEIAAKAIPRVHNLKGEGWIFLEEGILKPLSQKAPNLLPPDCSAETIKQIYALLYSNIFKSNYPGGGHFAGVFPFAGILEHSCMPNSRFAFEGPLTQNYYQQLKQCRVRLFAKKSIRKGERVLSSFFDTFMPTLSRQIHLRSMKNTRCFCLRCLDPRELGTDLGTQKCSSCSGWVVPADPLLIDLCDWKCLSCNKVISQDQALNTNYSLMDEIITLRNNESLTVKSLTEVQAKFAPYLHPNHWNCVDAKLSLIQIFKTRPQEIFRLSDTELDNNADICRDLLNLLLKPCLIIHADHRVSDCLLVLSNMNSEILKRKVASGIVDSSRAKLVERYCSDLKSIADRIVVSQCSDAELENLSIQASPF